MKIKSTVAEATKYSSDALEAFYTAVENGQARLALLILVDVIEEFADRFDALEIAAPNEITSEVATKTEVTPANEEVKPSETNVAEDKPAPKAKAVAKENAAE
jgi:hypothetical protein